MTLDRSKSQNYPKISSAEKNGGAGKNDYATLARRKKERSEIKSLPTFSSKKKSVENEQSVEREIVKSQPAVRLPAAENQTQSVPAEEFSYAETQRASKRERVKLRDESLLGKDNWLARNGHTVTYFLLYLFSAFVFFRPYEWNSQLGFLEIGAFVLAIATLLVYLPTQVSIENSATILTTEVKCVLCLVGLAIVTMPISKDPKLAWQTFNDVFIKAVVMFVVMVNVLRTRRRLVGIIWLSFGISLILSYIAMGMAMRGEFKAEGYRVQIDFGGMLGNPNDFALHLVTMTPIAICLGLASKNYLWRILYFGMAILFVAANVVTYSRGAFLGLIVVCAMLVWKIGRRQRFKTIIVSAFVGIVFILLAPGNYGLRLLSIFVPSLDAVGSSDQRRQLLEQSILVTLRNPWGIGIGCFPVVGLANLQTHNAFTQVSSELGLLGLAAYLIFMVSPIRKLSAIERTLYEKNQNGWVYYMSIGMQASIAGFMVSSFFGPVAYNWFIYYLVAYAVSLRRIYQIEKGDEPRIASRLKED